VSQVEASADAFAVLEAARMVFWDFDGVVKDSVDAKGEAFVRLFLGSEPTIVSRIRRHHERNGGMSRFEKLPIYLRWVGEEPSPGLVEAYAERFEAEVVESVIASPWVGGVREYINERRRDRVFVLVTATPQSEIERILFRLGIADCFTGVHGSPGRKRDAMQAEMLSAHVSPTDAVLVGDSETDLQAAVETGCRFILRLHETNRHLLEHHSGPVLKYLDPQLWRTDSGVMHQ
jgi:phosphoglycolate phosphatase-like HAD superfamily hydrolase